VVTVDLRMNEPRYVKLPDIMKAKKKPLDTLALDELNIERAAAIREVRFEPPSEREKGVIVDDVASLVTALKDKGLL
jgi:electron transfer flavoprotein beta subunit